MKPAKKRKSVKKVSSRKSNSKKRVQKKSSTPPDAKTIGLDTTRKENLKLRYELKRQSQELTNKARDLEIEASLERVRAVAMNMGKPDDLLNICQAFYKEFQLLGFRDLRNAMINIHDDAHRSFLNYDYSKTGKSITPFTYDIHPVIKKLVKKVRSSREAFSTSFLKGKELEDFKQFRENNGEKTDAQLKKATAIYYYFHSTGTGAIGISNLNQASLEQIEILKRFRNVFELAYRRYADIEKAETQAREAQIEAALESVRASSMAMHHSDELEKVVKTLSDKLIDLGLSLDGALIFFFEREKRNFHLWIATNHLPAPIKVDMPYHEDIQNNLIIRSLWEAIETGGDFINLSFSGKEKNDYFRFVARNNESKIPEAIRKFQLEAESWTLSFTVEKNAVVGIDSWSGYVMTQQAFQVLKRFAKVFEQAYTRFLDLQKAEAQAREAQIQLALERVRARTMAMQHSDELADASHVLERQVAALGIKTWSCAFHIFRENDSLEYHSNADGVKPTYVIPRTYVWQRYYEACQRGETLYIEEHAGEACTELYEYMAAMPIVGEELQKMKAAGIPFPTYQVDHAASFKYGYLLFITFEQVPEAHDIFIRFAKVFEQTYTRFLDLQKAEAQAREAQIEAALEKVRSRSLAMHSSTELQEVVKVVFEKLRELNVALDVANIAILFEDLQELEIWTAAPGLSYAYSFKIPYSNHAIFADGLDAYKKGLDFYSKSYLAKEKNDYYNFLFEKSNLKNIPEDRKKIILSAENYSVTAAREKTISMQLINYSVRLSSENENEILKRFVKVFSQAHTRFIDLQKAEAQAREAQIEAALERVRSRTMAMQRSGELAEISFLLVKQVLGLGIKTWGCAFNIFDEDQPSSTEWFSNEQGYKSTYKTPREGIFLRYYEAAQRGESLHVEEFRDDACIEHYRYLSTLPGLEDEMKMYVEHNVPLPTSQFDNVVYFKYGYLLFVTYEDVPEAHDIFKRFAKVFEQTYTRFLDLQKAEAQAREAQIEAALEKIRSRSLAMQRSNELKDVVAIVFEKLRELGLLFDGSGLQLFKDASSKDSILWIRGVILSEPVLVNYPYDEDAIKNSEILNDIWKTKENGGTVMNKTYSFEEKNKMLEYVGKYNDNNVPPEVVEKMMQAPDYTATFIMEKNSGLWVDSWSGQRISIEEFNVLKRVARVFEQAYTRFLDLQKVEAQARESQIQLALERVRARTMAMHQSDELREVVKLLYDQLRQVGFSNRAANIALMKPDTGDMQWWMSGFGQDEFPDSYFVKYFNNPALNEMLHRWKSGDKFASIRLTGESKKKFDQAFLFESDFGRAPEEIKLQMAALDSVVFSLAYMKYGALNVGHEAINDEQTEILQRFAIVFEQTYTRFLDLQKAEAQARESQIQLALERVRARTMAMQHSDELAEAAALLFKQVQLLDLPVISCGFNIWQPGDQVCNAYMSDEAGFIQPPFKIPLTESPVFIHFSNSRLKDEIFYVEEIRGEVLAAHYKYMLTLPVFAEIADKFLKGGFAFPDFQVNNVANFLYGNLIFITNEPVPEAHDIFKRFGKVFEQTYTRFLDLQKAEAQAREAEIELALERVRARTMAMQKSNELAEAAQLLYEEFRTLNINTFLCGYCFYKEEQNKQTVWVTLPDGTIIPDFVDFPIAGDPVLNKRYEDWKQRTPLHVLEMQGEANKEHHRFLSSKVSDQTAREIFAQIPDRIIVYCANFSIGYLFIIATEFLTAEEENVIIRFAKVFEQTYTRFLDLQKAEAQARESQIEAALERVRSRSMGMQKGDELREVIQLIYEQFVHLNIQINTVGFILDYKERDDLNFWIANKMGAPTKQQYPYFDSPHWNLLIEAKQKGLDFFADTLTFEEKNKFFQQIFEYVTSMPDEAKNFFYASPGWASSTVLLQNVGLFIDNLDGTPFVDEANAILMRFGKVFQQTYTRFLDLQKAEEQAIETIKRASVDRVRAEIASMRTTADLQRITPLVWNELKTLGVPFTRCGVFIMDESQRQIHTFLSTPEGKAITSFHLPYDAPGAFNEIVGHWQEKKKFVKHWGEAEFLTVADALMKQGTIANREQYMATVPSGVYLHCLPFLQGMLYVGNTESLGEDELQLAQNLADAFSTAYARYEDFNKLEAANIKIEKTLTDLKQTQTQLVQSEKMASLGELTAGIAHEIQNPLNFVNNFSEVSNELIDEMNEELEKGDIAEAKVIAKDVKQNLEKINQHGKRAGDIVKGMLQHSRTSSGQKELTDINALCDEYLRLSYHGLRAKDKSFNAKFETDFDSSLLKIKVIPQDIGRVILNLINNAFYAVSEKKKSNIENYEPTVLVSTHYSLSPGEGKGEVIIKVKDNGTGIPEKVKEKIFQPFFTTKPTGQGTGLGLSLSYDIVKAHGGEIKVETKDNEGTKFIISLPIQL